MVIEGSRGQGFKDSSEKLKNYKELNIWQKSYELYLKIYKITAIFPNEERYGLTSQIRRFVVSIPSNIAEEYERKTTLDYNRMLYISYGSARELGTQILLAGDLGFIEKGELGTEKRHSRNRKNAKGADKVFRKQTLESLNPGILGPSSPTKLEKNLKF